MDSLSATKRQKRAHGPRTRSNKTHNGTSVHGDDSKAIQAESVEYIPPFADVLYNISCNKTRSANHPVPAFRDPPVPGAPSGSMNRSDSTRSHLNGTVPLFDLQAFMDNDEDDIAFAVLRTVECSEASVLMASRTGHIRYSEGVYIKSKFLRDAIHKIATCYFQPTNLRTQPPAYTSSGGRKPDDMESFDQQNRIDPLDLFLFHHRHLLESHTIEFPESKQHVDAFLKYTNSRYGAEFVEAKNLFAKGLVTKAHILFLFKPNEIIISGTYGKPTAFILQYWPELGKDGWVTLRCWSFQSDGSGFARKKSVLSIPPIEPETIRIQDLVAYPLQYATTELQDNILDRGIKHWELRIATQVTYKGWNVAKDQYFPDARFMIDHQIYRKMHEHAQAFRFEKPAETHPFDRMPPYLNIEQKPSRVCFYIMPPDIHGFYLNEKKWIKLFVDCVQPVSWNKKAFERLVLPPQTKDLVRALVTVRTSQRGIKQGLGVAGKRTDITNGKGNGLIMLLHGGPGTGKTLTGESVAEIAEMPLYRVTCGDIGNNAEAVEKYLNTVLHLGKTWNCVLLLDEADVFLEERSMADLKRNSLVSVFLRILEYYDGILILTSNRVGIFDEAFKSRIQVALHYENLTRSTRKKIWQNFLDMLEEDEEDVNYDEIKFHLDDLAGKELNGRQIRNVLTTARQLAIYRNERLDWKHLAQALAVSSDFTEYLKRMQGHTDDQRARDEGLR
ncbi:P-loop containing nucleoside triphosphate hydrolase protein [Viridothelium virens]|uniref:P-loop containing nucleoside triphosphate hydrolase protein n=1 Tax=Viridothelium virens TaxID=1048519 RepID=A0A6A6HNT2_VIRVR|nr:P-loop containing nucleoside triphosphate hydrolase protein [Viridothelium virens]